MSDYATPNYTEQGGKKTVIGGELAIVGKGKITKDGAPVNLGGSSSLSWGDITGKPSTFPPSAHTHTAAQISDASDVGKGLMTAKDAATARSLIQVPAAPTAGTAALLQAGTDTTARIWTAKDIHDEIARQIAAAAGS